MSILSEADESSDEPASFTIEDPDGNPILVDQYRGKTNFKTVFFKELERCNENMSEAFKTKS